MVTVDRAEAGGWGCLSRFAVHARLAIVMRFALLALVAALWVRPASAELREDQDQETVGGVAASRTGEVDRGEVYRIVVQQGISEKEAQDFKLHMEGLGYVPLILGDFTEDGKASVFYGNFANKIEAEKARADLRRSSISSVAVVSVKRPTPSYTIIVSSFRERSEADTQSRKLAAAGHVGAKVVSQANFYYVTIGEYPSYYIARNVLASLKNEGHDRAEVVERSADGTLSVVDPAVTAAAAALAKAIEAAVGDLGDQPSEEQKEEVARRTEEKVKLAIADASGDILAAERILQIDSCRGIKSSDVQKVVEEVEAERARREEVARRTVEIAHLIRDAEGFMKAENYDEAIGKLDHALKIDPDNNLAMVRKKTAEDLKTAEGACREDEPAILRSRKSEAMALAARGDQASLHHAKALWISIKGLDTKFANEADAAIAKIDTAIDAQQSIVCPAPRSGFLFSVVSAGAFLTSGAILGTVLLRRRRRSHDKSMHPDAPSG